MATVPGLPDVETGVAPEVQAHNPAALASSSHPVAEERQVA